MAASTRYAFHVMLNCGEGVTQRGGHFRIGGDFGGGHISARQIEHHLSIGNQDGGHDGERFLQRGLRIQGAGEALHSAAGF